MSAKLSRRLCAILAVGLVLSLSFAGIADARRGGSFGSRGARTYTAPATTATAPQSVGPVQRSMTSPNQPGYGQPAYGQPGFGFPRRGLFGGWGGPILGGLFAAGLFGLLGGHGFGGGGGFLALIVQIGLIALLASLAMRLFRRRGFGNAFAGPAMFQPPSPYGGAPGPQPMGHAPSGPWGGRDGVGLIQADFDAFEQLLTEIQAAYSREDYEGLRARTTPEVMSYFAEELAQGAAGGRRNEVRDLRLLSGDLSEAWSEDAHDYATVALRYSSVDVMRDRADGHVVEGGDEPSETTEVWTFVRDRASPWGQAWKLSAIQS